MTCGVVELPAGCGVGPAGTIPAGSIGYVDGPVDPLPKVANFSPNPGVPIARLAHIQFDVTDDSDAFIAIFVTATFPDGNCECVWDSNSFSPRYLAGSSRVDTQCGYRFTVKRTGGWYATPVRLDVIAIDADGNIATTRIGF